MPRGASCSPPDCSATTSVTSATGTTASSWARGTAPWPPSSTPRTWTGWRRRSTPSGPPSASTHCSRPTQRPPGPRAPSEAARHRTAARTLAPADRQTRMRAARCHVPWRHWAAWAWAGSGAREAAGGLTVTLSPLGIWGVHRRLRSQGWHVPVLGTADRNGAVGLLMTLASGDAEDGETEIGTWLADRSPVQAARELIQAAAGGSPGLRGAAFAVLDRIGDAAIDEIRAALDDPLLRAHAAVWLHEHDEEADLRPADRTWLLVDLGAGLLEEADPRDVVAELLPEGPARAQE